MSTITGPYKAGDMIVALHTCVDGSTCKTPIPVARVVPLSGMRWRVEATRCTGMPVHYVVNALGVDSDRLIQGNAEHTATEMKCGKCGRRMHADTVNMLDQCLGCGASPFPEEVVDTVDCSSCETPIVPENEDGETALICPCGEWHHYEHCAGACSEYVADLAYSMAEDRASENRAGL